MHDIWNPWHGCAKVSEGCANCYMYAMDKARGLDGSVVRLNKGGFDYPLQRRRDGSFKVRSGELIRVCMTSDFLVPEADAWRDEAWGIIHQRPDVRFYILTKRPERLAACLPHDWGEGWDNVALNVTCEDQRRADERVPILLATPAKHKGVMCAPFIAPVSIGRYLDACQDGAMAPEGPRVEGAGIEQVICGGENYEGSRPCDFAWVRALRDECAAHDVSFTFIETGTVFIKDGRAYRLPRRIQSQQAWKSRVSFVGKPIRWELHDPLGLPLDPSELARPRFRSKCATCGSLPICDGCSDCGRCPAERLKTLEELLGREAALAASVTWPAA